jgi:hypothetical protein
MSGTTTGHIKTPQKMGRHTLKHSAVWFILWIQRPAGEKEGIELLLKKMDNLNLAGFKWRPAGARQRPWFERDK